MKNFEYTFINEIRSKVIPDAHKKHYGSYMSFDDAPISPGCMSCKTGGWLCSFIGTACNCTCGHCPNPDVNGNNDISISNGYGQTDIDRILEILEKPHFTGVGISGGEPLMYIDKLVEWITKIKKKYPNLYVWHYTNGLLATEDNLKRVAEAGIDEVRFDLAADNYSHKVLSNMERAVKIIPSVSIEVPVILEQYNNLIEAIDFADSIGVKYLNIHDLYINEKLFKDGLGGYIRSFDRISKIHRDIISSSILIYKVFRRIKDNELKIVPNDCTLINMQMQTLGLYYQYFQNQENSEFMTFDQYMEYVFKRYDEGDLLIENI